MIKSKLGFIRGEDIETSEDNETEIETEINEDNREDINEDSETEIESEINEDSEGEINEEGINEGINKKVIVNKEDRISDGFMSEYEYVRVLSIRSKQIMLGGKIMINGGEELRKKMNPRMIAEMEIREKCCPLIIVREMCNGMVEKWSVNELEVLI